MNNHDDDMPRIQKSRTKKERKTNQLDFIAIVIH